jgi:hypothetical protein
MNAGRITASAVAVALWIVAASTSAAAQETTTITLASGAGITLPYYGATVPDPSVQVSRDGGATWMPAHATQDPWGDSPFAGATWVEPQPQLRGNPESLRYRISFFLPSGIAAPSLTGRVSADDQTAAVIVNGTAIYALPSGWAVWPQGCCTHDYATTDASLFVCGTNVLEFDTVNLGGVGGITFSANVSWQGGSATPCDTTAPVVTVPASFAVDATGPDGAAVSFTATASDAGGTAGPVVCSPSSGSTFAIGVTTVVCSSTDSYGNVGTAGFTITVNGASAQVTKLAGLIATLGNLAGNSFSSQLQGIQAQIAAGDSACASLDEFIAHVDAQTVKPGSKKPDAGKKLTAAEAAEILAVAAQIKGTIGC